MLDPLNYRVLAILSNYCRKWADARLRDLTPWTRQWISINVFVGAPGVGADDGWYQTSLDLEEIGA